jgi:hypothetical protein
MEDRKMLKGLIIFEDGSVQQVGELINFKPIITTLEKLLPQLQQQWDEYLVAQLTPEQLERAKKRLYTVEGQE